MVSARTLFGACLALFATAAAAADRSVYKSVDAAGNVTYSDRKSRTGDTRVRNWAPANLSRYEYDIAVWRAQSDREFYGRLLAERRQPVPVVIYDPRAWQTARSQQSYTMGGTRWRSGWDPNLPGSPAPSLERNYYYNGR